MMKHTDLTTISLFLSILSPLVAVLPSEAIPISERIPQRSLLVASEDLGIFLAIGTFAPAEAPLYGTELVAYAAPGPSGPFARELVDRDVVVFDIATIGLLNGDNVGFVAAVGTNSSFTGSDLVYYERNAAGTWSRYTLIHGRSRGGIRRFTAIATAEGLAVAGLDFQPQGPVPRSQRVVLSRWEFPPSTFASQASHQLAIFEDVSPYRRPHLFPLPPDTSQTARLSGTGTSEGGLALLGEVDALLFVTAANGDQLLQRVSRQGVTTTTIGSEVPPAQFATSVSTRSPSSALIATWHPDSQWEALLLADMTSDGPQRIERFPMGDGLPLGGGSDVAAAYFAGLAPGTDSFAVAFEDQFFQYDVEDGKEVDRRDLGDEVALVGSPDDTLDVSVDVTLDGTLDMGVELAGSNLDTKTYSFAQWLTLPSTGLDGSGTAYLGLGDRGFNLYPIDPETGDDSRCRETFIALCPLEKIFRITMSYRLLDGTTGSARTVEGRSDTSGLFWIFDLDNWEAMVKMLDGCAINDHYWFFSAATTNLEYTLEVTDTRTGVKKSYHNPQGERSPAFVDTTTFGCVPEDRSPPGTEGSHRERRLETGWDVAAGSAPRSLLPRAELRSASAGSCGVDGTEMCLNERRFRVEVEWTDLAGNRGVGRAVPFGSDNSGLFWFFEEENWEVLVKVLDGCGLNDRYWVFSAATTTVGYTLRVTDTETGEVREYRNPAGRASYAITDTDAFATCP